jgi:hypothetical protein
MIQELELLLIAAGIEYRTGVNSLHGHPKNWWCVSGLAGVRSFRVSDKNVKVQYADSVAQAFLLVLECQ